MQTWCDTAEDNFEGSIRYVFLRSDPSIRVAKLLICFTCRLPMVTRALPASEFADLDSQHTSHAPDCLDASAHTVASKRVLDHTKRAWKPAARPAAMSSMNTKTANRTEGNCDDGSSAGRQASRLLLG